MRNAFRMQSILLAALVATVGTAAVAAPTGKDRVTKVPASKHLDVKALEGGFYNFAPGVLTKQNMIHPGRPVDAARLPSGDTLTRLDYTFVTGEAVGTTPSDHLFRPAMSGNGNFISYTSLAQNLTADDSFGIAQTYRTDISTPTGTNVLVSKNASDVAGNGASGMPTFFADGPVVHDFYYNSISDDGTKVVFTSNATNLQTAVTDDNDGTDVFLWNAGTVTLISTNSAGTQMNVDSLGSNTDFRFSRDGAISGDGNFVAFLSNATLPGTTARASNFATTQTQTSIDVFRKNLGTNATQLVSHAAGTPTVEGDTGDSFEPTISADGGRIAYSSLSRNVVSPAAPSSADDANFGPRTDVFLWNAGTDATTNLSIALNASVPTGAVACFTPVISSNGKYVAWNSRKANLAGIVGAPDANRFAYIRDVDQGASAIRQVNTTTGFAWLDPGLTRAMTPTPLNNGDVVFQSYGSIFANDAAKLNNYLNVYVKTWTNAWPAVGNAGTISMVSQSAGGTASNMSGGCYTDGFISGAMNRIYSNTAGTKLMFAHRATFGSFNTAGLLNAFVANVTPGASYTVTGLDRFPKAVSKAGVTVSFAGNSMRNTRTHQRVAISANGRYVGLVLAGGPTPLEVNSPAGPSAPRAYSGLAVGDAVRIDLTSGELAYANFEDQGGSVLVPLEDSAGGALTVGEDPPGSFSSSIFPTGNTSQTKEMAVSNFGQVAFMSFSFPNPGGVAQTFDGTSGWLYVVDPTAGTSLTVKSSNPGTPQWGASTAGFVFPDVALCMTPDGRYVGFTTSRSNVHPDTPGGVEMAYIADTTNPTATRLISRRSAATTFFAQDVPLEDCLMVGLANDGQRAVFLSQDAEDVFISGSPNSLRQMFMFNDLSDGVPGNGDNVGGAVVVQISASGAGASFSNTDTTGNTLSSGFTSTASIDGNATKYAFPGVISGIIPDSPAGLGAGVAGSQLYIKSLAGTVDSNGAVVAPLSILSRKTGNNLFLEPVNVDVNNLITNVSTFEDIDQVTLSNDGAYMAVVTNARSDASNGFLGALGEDQNSPLVPVDADTASVYDVFVVENLGTTPTWTLASQVTGQTPDDQATIGSEGFRQVQTATSYAANIAVTQNGRIRVVFGYEGDNVLNPADTLFGRSVYLKEYFTPGPAAVTSDWSNYE